MEYCVGGVWLYLCGEEVQPIESGAFFEILIRRAIMARYFTAKQEAMAINVFNSLSKQERIALAVNRVSILRSECKDNPTLNREMIYGQSRLSDDYQLQLMRFSKNTQRACKIAEKYFPSTVADGLNITHKDVSGERRLLLGFGQDRDFTMLLDGALLYVLI